MLSADRGCDVTFALVHILSLAQQPNIPAKHTAYIGLSRLLNPTHEMALLGVNTVRKDLASSGMLAISLALAAVPAVVERDTLPAVLPLIMSHISHPHPIVRRRALAALQHAVKMDDAVLNSGSIDAVLKCMLDKDASVALAAVNLLWDVRAALIDVIKAVSDSLWSVLQRWMSDDSGAHAFQRMPAPFLVLRAVQLLAYLHTGQKCVYPFHALVSTHTEFRLEQRHCDTVLGLFVLLQTKTTRLAHGEYRQLSYAQSEVIFAAVMHELICLVVKTASGPLLRVAVSTAIAMMSSGDPDSALLGLHDIAAIAKVCIQFYGRFI